MVFLELFYPEAVLSSSIFYGGIKMNHILHQCSRFVLILLVMGLFSCNGENKQPGATTSTKNQTKTETRSETKPPPGNSPGSIAVNEHQAVAKARPECRLSIGWASWEPYQYKGRDGRATGMDIDIINAAINHTRCKVTYVEGDWADLLDRLKQGTLDAVASATLTEKRRSYAYFSEPYRAETFTIYVKNKDRERYSGMSIKSMLEAGMRLGAVMDYFYGATLNDFQDSEKYHRQFIYNDFSEANFALLFDNKVDGVLEDPFVGADLIRRRGWNEKLSKLPLVIHSGDVHLMFSKKSVSEKTVELINNALAKIKADGTFNRLIEHYGG